MEFVELAAIFGGLLSLFSAFISYRYTGERLKVEGELQQEIHKYLISHDEVLKDLKIAKGHGQVRLKVNDNFKDYEIIIEDALRSLPEDEREKVYPAIKQRSKRGRLAYMSKLLSKSVENA